MNSTKMLIAEDNLQFLHTMQDYLKKLMIEIISVTDGIAALEVMKRCNPDLILLDLNMPKLNGIEFLKKLEGFEGLSTNVIIISGERRFINKIPLESYKLIKGVFCKPVNLQDIYNNVKHILSNQNERNDIIKIKKTLELFEFNKSSKGYNLLIDCLNEIINNPNGLKNIEGVVYKNVAARNNFESIVQIKWCIAKAITSMIRFTDTKILNKYFTSSASISPKYFMRTIYDMIKSESYK